MRMPFFSRQTSQVIVPSVGGFLVCWEVQPPCRTESSETLSESGSICTSPVTKKRVQTALLEALFLKCNLWLSKPKNPLQSLADSVVSAVLHVARRAAVIVWRPRDTGRRSGHCKASHMTLMLINLGLSDGLFSACQPGLAIISVSVVRVMGTCREPVLNE